MRKLCLVAFPIVLLSVAFIQVYAKESNPAMLGYVRGLVIQAVEPNKLKVGGAEFKAIDNPKGEGFIVYDPRTEFSGVERYLLWVVIDDTAYALNGPSKMVTPGLKWPRDANPESWKKTGIDQYNGASEIIAVVFGK